MTAEASATYRQEVAERAQGKPPDPRGRKAPDQKCGNAGKSPKSPKPGKFMRSIHNVGECVRDRKFLLSSNLISSRWMFCEYILNLQAFAGPRKLGLVDSATASLCPRCDFDARLQSIIIYCQLTSSALCKSLCNAPRRRSCMTSTSVKSQRFTWRKLQCGSRALCQSRQGRMIGEVLIDGRRVLLFVQLCSWQKRSWQKRYFPGDWE